MGPRPERCPAPPSGASDRQAAPSLARSRREGLEQSGLCARTGLRPRRHHGPVPDPAPRRLTDRSCGRDPVRTPGADGGCPERAADVRALRLAAAEELETACRVLRPPCWRAEASVSLGPMQSRITEQIALMGETAGEVLAYAQAMRHLESAGEALDVLYRRGSRAPQGSHWRTATMAARPTRSVRLRAHFSFRSAIFRHALRVASRLRPAPPSPSPACARHLGAHGDADRAPA